MSQQTILNPFVVGKYVSDKYFCDRSEETAFLQKQLENGRNVAQAITSASFVKKYSLGSASSVQAAVKLLLKNDILTHHDGQYRIYDFFFSKWLARY